MAKVKGKTLNKIMLRKAIEGQLKNVGKLNRRERRKLARLQTIKPRKPKYEN